jgi:hypothetical protein
VAANSLQPCRLLQLLMLHLPLLWLLLVLTASPYMLQYLRPLNAMVYHPAFASIPAADSFVQKAAVL